MRQRFSKYVPRNLKNNGLVPATFVSTENMTPVQKDLETLVLL